MIVAVIMTVAVTVAVTVPMAGFVGVGVAGRGPAWIRVPLIGLVLMGVRHESLAKDAALGVTG